MKIGKFIKKLFSSSKINVNESNADLLCNHGEDDDDHYYIAHAPVESRQHFVNRTYHGQTKHSQRQSIYEPFHQCDSRQCFSPGHDVNNNEDDQQVYQNIDYLTYSSNSSNIEQLSEHLQPFEEYDKFEHQLNSMNSSSRNS